MKEVLGQNTNVLTKNISANTCLKPTFYNPKNPKKVNSGLETLRCLGPKIWSMVPDNVKNITSNRKIFFSCLTPFFCPQMGSLGTGIYQMFHKYKLLLLLSDVA